MKTFFKMLLGMLTSFSILNSLDYKIRNCVILQLSLTLVIASLRKRNTTNIVLIRRAFL